MSIPKGNTINFETLKRAVKNGDIALMECTDKKTNEKVDAICAVHRKDNEYQMVPLAIMYRENPYDRLTPPEESEKS